MNEDILSFMKQYNSLRDKLSLASLSYRKAYKSIGNVNHLGMCLQSSSNMSEDSSYSLRDKLALASLSSRKACKLFGNITSAIICIHWANSS